jgi:hypothetical protein
LEQTKALATILLLAYCWQDGQTRTMARTASTVEVFSCALGKKLCHIALSGKAEKHRPLPFADEIGTASLANAVAAC